MFSNQGRFFYLFHFFVLFCFIIKAERRRDAADALFKEAQTKMRKHETELVRRQSELEDEKQLRASEVRIYFYTIRR